MTETAEQRSRWDNAEPGQPRPPQHEGSYCNDRHDNGWRCDRLEGHSGQHVACGFHKVCVTWGGGVL